jgi:hypothetical protein
MVVPRQFSLFVCSFIELLYCVRSARTLSDTVTFDGDVWWAFILIIIVLYEIIIRDELCRFLENLEKIPRAAGTHT